MGLDSFGRFGRKISRFGIENVFGVIFGDDLLEGNFNVSASSVVEYQIDRTDTHTHALGMHSIS